MTVVNKKPKILDKQLAKLPKKVIKTGSHKVIIIFPTDVRVDKRRPGDSQRMHAVAAF